MSQQVIGVVGGGTMGGGIAQTASQFGRRVILLDLGVRLLEATMSRIEKSLQRGVEKGRLSAEEKSEVVGRIATTIDLGRLEAADFIIEAIVEEEEAKKDLFRRLDEAARPGIILASNTSSISITRIAAVTRRPQRVIGMHFMNPVPVMRLVEVIRGLETSDDTLSETTELAKSLEKIPVEVNDFPGFVSNRVLMPMINEAIYCVMEGVAEPEAVDAVMKLGMNHPMGPLQLADFIGLDVCLSILEVLHRGLGDDKYRPCPLLRRYVDAGRLGRKTGRGFYDHPQA